MINRMNYILSLSAAVLLILLFTQFTVKRSTDKTEQMNYTVIKKYDKFEVRMYPKIILASSKMNTSSFSRNSYKGFKTIADYIFGGNQENKKIAMTSPVIGHMKDSMVMSFVMPSEYTVEDLPKPNSNQVYINEMETKKLAVIRFNGFANDIDIKNHTRWLKKYLDKENIEYTDNVFFYGYNPPYQLFGRINEVAIEIKPSK